MKVSAIACAVLAGTFGFSTLASAQDWRGGHDRDGGQRSEQHQERRGDRGQQQDRSGHQERNDRGSHEQRGGNWQQQQQHRYVQQQPNYAPQYNQRAYTHNQPQYNQRASTYNAPDYRNQGQRFYRGGYVPHEYRSGGYYVRDWHSHRGLYAPPAGYQWMQVGSEFLLVALATGLIANLLTSSY
jgi:Ni/Co efflux regulator RcnB